MAGKSRNISLIVQSITRLSGGNDCLLARVYFAIFVPFFLISTAYCISTGNGFLILIVFWILLALLVFPCAVTVLIIINKTSGSMVDVLYGQKRYEDHSEKIRNSEILKITELRENKKFERMLVELLSIEKQYGTSSRLVYERTLCLMEQGRLREARTCLKRFLSGPRPKEEDNSYYGYCEQLFSDEGSPLRLGKIVQKDQG